MRMRAARDSDCILSLMKTIPVLFMSLIGFAGVAGASPKKPAVSMEQARATALERAPGKVKSAELEEEGGHLIYSFDIRDANRRIVEVNVDAETGKVLAVEHESAAKEREEAKAERKAKQP